MFGFSITKLLFTIAAVFVVWHGFKWYARAQQIKANRKEKLRPGPGGTGGAGSAGGAGGPGEATASVTQDMVRCDVCDTYIPADTAASCGRADCPYPG